MLEQFLFEFILCRFSVHSRGTWRLRIPGKKKFVARVLTSLAEGMFLRAPVESSLALGCRLPFDISYRCRVRRAMNLGAGPAQRATLAPSRQAWWDCTVVAAVRIGKRVARSAGQAACLSAIACIVGSWGATAYVRTASGFRHVARVTGDRFHGGLPPHLSCWGRCVFRALVLYW